MPTDKPHKERLDKLLVDRGLCETRSQAQGLILAGEVRVNETVITKAGTLYLPDVTITLKNMPRYVSRGGLKLEHALKTFQVDVSDRVCLDVGASTGGFTDCLLQHGAKAVYAVDVGYGQLDWRLRQDPRVHVMERQHIRNLDSTTLNPAPSLGVVDVSFISLKKVLPQTVLCLSQSEITPILVTLVKPQFEYLDYCAVKGFDGIVSDPADHQQILEGLIVDLERLLPTMALMGMTCSPLTGAKGNREFLFYFAARPIDFVVPDWTAMMQNLVTTV